MEEEVLVKIDKKLDAIVRLLASQCVTGKNKKDAILTLANLGLDQKLIAGIVGVPPNSVSARISESKKEKPAKNEKSNEEAK